MSFLRILLIAAAATAVVPMVSGCTTAGQDDPPANIQAASPAPGRPILIVRPASSTRPSMMSEVTGRLVQSGRCLFVVQDEYRWLMTWPTGSTLRARTGGGYEVVVPERGAIPVGAEITVEGGQLDGSSASTVFGVAIPDECRGPFWVTDPGGVRLR